MPITLSKGLRDHLLKHGSLEDALHNGAILIYSGTQPNSADNAPNGTLLNTITQASASRTAEVLATGTVTLSGSGGQVDTLTVNSVSVIGAVVPYTTDLATTAALLAAEINRTKSYPKYKATSSGDVVTISALPGTGSGPNAFVVACGVSGGTLGQSTANLSGGVTAANGIKFGDCVDGTLSKAGSVWSGQATGDGVAAWARFVGSVSDPGGATTSTFRPIRLDLPCSVGSGANVLNLTSLNITSGNTDTIDSCDITMPDA